MNNEEEIIARMLAKNKALTTNNKIKSGVTEDGELKDLQAAIQRGASSCCSLLHDWNSENAKIVGHVVRVYWDGEKEWFSGTIVNYDYRTGKHYVYYDLDSTAEWVDLKTEPSIVTADICLAKFGAQIWPAYTHIISDSGKCILKHSKTSGEYIEFIDETRSNGYVSKNNIFPYKPPTSLITSDMTEFFDASVDPISHTKSTKPLKRSSLSPKMLHSHKIALAEMAELKKTIGLIKEELMRQAKASLHGVEWVGTSIRMHTDYLKHSCEDSDRAAEEDPLLDRNKIVKSSQSTLATGIVAQYCPGIDECFVVFDETLSDGNSHQDRLLIPRWLNLEALAQEQEDFLENESASVFDGSAFTIVSRHETTTSCSSDSCFIDENVPVSILDRTWLERRSSLQSDTRGCTLCLRGDYDRYKNANGECKLEDYNLEHCVQCGVICHRYCMPMQKIGLVENQEWWCWACTVCQGCHTPSWLSEQHMWNIKRADIPLLPNLMRKYRMKLNLEDSMGDAVVTSKKMSKAQITAQAAIPLNLATADIKAATEASLENPKILAVCAECIYRYKHLKSYCPLCYQLYPVDETTCTTAVSVNKSIAASLEVLNSSNKNKTHSKTPDQLLVTAHPPADSKPNIAGLPDSTTDSNGTLAVGVVSENCASDNDHTNNGGFDKDSMIQCNECARWVHAMCEGIDQVQYEAITYGTHPVWGDEYLCPGCRVDVPTVVIEQLVKQDKLQMFAEPVTKAMAPTYFDIIRNPMDLQTMKSKASKGMYKSLQALRYDVEQMCLNAIIFNKSGDEYWVEAKDYYSRVCSKILAKNPRKTFITQCGRELNELIDAHLRPSKKNAAAKMDQKVMKSKVKASEEKSYAKVFNSGSSHRRNKSLLDGGRSRKSVDGVNYEANDDKLFCQPIGNDNSDIQVEKNDVLVLPSVRRIPNDPVNRLVDGCVTFVINSTDALYQCSKDICLVCAADVSPECAIFCMDCGECFHEFCADRNSKGNLIRNHQWKCINCYTCSTCNKPISGGDGSDVVGCHECGVAFHKGCVLPRKIPGQLLGEWYCQQCCKCRICSDSDGVSRCWSFVQGGYCDTCIRAVTSKTCLVTKLSNSPGNCILCVKPIDTPSEKYIKCSYCEESVHLDCELRWSKSAGVSSLLPLCDDYSTLESNAYVVVDGKQVLVKKRMDDTNGEESFIGNSSSSSCDYKCIQCRELLPGPMSGQSGSELMGDPSKQSSSDNGKKRLQLLLDEINRKRRYQESKVLHDLINHKREIVLSPSDRLLIQSVVQWGFIRCFFMQTHYSMAFARCALLQERSLEMQRDSAMWLRRRSFRFAGLWNAASESLLLETMQIVPLDIKSSLSTCQKHYLLGLNKNGEPFEDLMLCKLATMASAFIEFSECELNSGPYGKNTIAFSELQHLHMLFGMRMFLVKKETSGMENILPTSSYQKLPDPLHIFATHLYNLVGSVVTHDTFPVTHNNINTMFLEKLCSIVSHVDVNAKFTSDSNHKLFMKVIRLTVNIFTQLPPITMAHCKSTVHTDINYYTDSRVDIGSDCVRATGKYMHHCLLLNSVMYSQEELLAKLYLPYVKSVKNNRKAHGDAANLDSIELKKRKRKNMAWNEMKPSSKVLKTEPNDHSGNSVEMVDETDMSIDASDNRNQMRTGSDSGNAVESVVAEPSQSAVPKKVAYVTIGVDTTCPTSGYYSKYEVNRSRYMGGNPQALGDHRIVTVPSKSWHCIDGIIVDDRVCNFCRKGDVFKTSGTKLEHKRAKVEGSGGRLIPFADGTNESSYVHVNCLRYSNDVFESGGYVTGSVRALDKSTHKSCSACYICGKNGASLKCHKTSCRRVFHFPCAVAFGCNLYEAKQSLGDQSKKSLYAPPVDPESTNKLHDLTTCMVCPEHIDSAVDIGKDFSRYMNRTLPPPLEPLRPVVMKEFHEVGYTDRVATALSTGRDEKTARTGACVVHCIGTPRIDGPRFHDENIIYSHHFRSTRIYWSMIHPGQRTLYKFEILTEGDLSVEDYDKLLVRPSSVRFIKNNNTIVAAQNRIKKREMVANGLSIPDTTDNYEEPSELHQAEEAHPVFQVIAMDDYCKKANGNSNNSYLRKNVDSMLSSEVATTASSSCFYNSMISYSIDELYLDIYHGARRCNAQQWGLSLDSSTNAFSPSSTALEVPYKTYGRNAFQFFGLTFPHVRCAIEMLIESVAAMITSVHVAPFTAPYKPCYKLPTPAAVMKIQQYQIELRSTSVAVLPSISGSARTDIRESSSNVVHKAPSTSDLSGEKKAVRFLTKSAGATRGSDAWTSDRPNKSTSAASLRLLKKELAENPDAYDDAVFGLNESEYLDWYDVIGTNDTDGVITLTPHQRRIIERNRARYYELAHNYLENPYRRLHVKKSHIHGFGLFTKTHFSKHEMIIEYIGEKIRQVVADKREQRYEDEGVGSCYMFRLDKEEIIDATKLGGMARFINHSCQPNAYARVVATDEMFTEKRIIIFAGKDILEGEEVTYDYKFPIEDEKLSCFCGAIGCKGSMN